MVTVKDMVDDVLSLFNEMDEVKTRYNEARSRLLDLLKKKGQTEVSFRGGNIVLVERYRKLNEPMLRSNYPEIYLAGMEYKFNQEKAKENYPRNIIKKALEECSEEVNEYVKIQFNRRRRKI